MQPQKLCVKCLSKMKGYVTLSTPPPPKENVTVRHKVSQKVNNTAGEPNGNLCINKMFNTNMLALYDMFSSLVLDFKLYLYILLFQLFFIKIRMFIVCTFLPQ